MRQRRTSVRRCACVGLLIAMVSACDDTPLPVIDALSPLRAQTLAWGTCAAGSHPDAQCATMLVPVTAMF